MLFRSPPGTNREAGSYAGAAGDTHIVVLEDVDGDKLTIDYGGLASDFDKVAPEARKVVDSVKWGDS